MTAPEWLSEAPLSDRTKASNGVRDIDVLVAVAAVDVKGTYDPGWVGLSEVILCKAVRWMWATGGDFEDRGQSSTTRVELTSEKSKAEERRDETRREEELMEARERCILAFGRWLAQSKPGIDAVVDRRHLCSDGPNNATARMLSNIACHG